MKVNFKLFGVDCAVCASKLESAINKLSFIVGLYHFFMPLLGMVLGEIILNFIHIKPDIIVFVVLFFIGIQMMVESFKTEKNSKYTLSLEST